MSYKRFMPITLLDSHNYFLGCTGQALSSLFTFVKTEAQRGEEPWSKSHTALGSKAWMRGHVLGLLAQRFLLLWAASPWEITQHIPQLLHCPSAGLLHCPREAFLEWLWKRRTGEGPFLPLTMNLSWWEVGRKLITAGIFFLHYFTLRLIIYKATQE